MARRPRYRNALQYSLLASICVLVFVFIGSKRQSEAREIAAAFDQTEPGAKLLEHQKNLEVCATKPEQCAGVMQKFSEQVAMIDPLRKNMANCLTGMKQTPEQCRNLINVMSLSEIPAANIQNHERPKS